MQSLLANPLLSWIHDDLATQERAPRPRPYGPTMQQVTAPIRELTPEQRARLRQSVLDPALVQHPVALQGQSPMSRPLKLFSALGPHLVWLDRNTVVYPSFSFANSLRWSRSMVALMNSSFAFRVFSGKAGINIDITGMIFLW